MGLETVDARDLDQPGDLGRGPEIGELPIDGIDDRDQGCAGHYRLASIVHDSPESPDPPTFSKPAR